MPEVLAQTRSLSEFQKQGKGQAQLLEGVDESGKGQATRQR